jgi:hypothetical protein
MASVFGIHFSLAELSAKTVDIPHDAVEKAKGVINSLFQNLQGGSENSALDEALTRP